MTFDVAPELLGTFVQSIARMPSSLATLKVEGPTVLIVPDIIRSPNQKFPLSLIENAEELAKYESGVVSAIVTVVNKRKAEATLGYRVIDVELNPKVHMDEVDAYFSHQIAIVDVGFTAAPAPAEGSTTEGESREPSEAEQAGGIPSDPAEPVQATTPVTAESGS